MFKSKNLPLRSGEIIVEVIKPTSVHGFFRVGLGLVILLINSFFTFWFIQKGVEGKAFYIIVMILGLYLIFYGTLLRRSNYLVITNERVFDIQRESLFSETLSALSLLDLVDVVVEKRGLLAVILNYGILTLHPRDGKFKFEIERVPKPSRVQNLLFEKRDHANRSNQYLNNSALLKQMLKIIPELSEAELTMLYQRVNSQLATLADDSSVKEEKMV